MLASSVNFEVELITLAFIEALQSRPLYCADMDKGIGLAIIANKEAEALHRIEEFDSPCGLFTRQLALWCAACRGCAARCTGTAAALNRNYIANNLQILRRSLSAAINQIIFQRLTFGETFKSGTFNSADMNKYVFAAAILLDEAEALLSVEELYDTFAGANNLRRHAAETAASSACTATAAASAAAEAAATASTAATAAIAAATAEPITATKTVTAAVAVTAKATATKRIEVIFPETIALVAAPSTAPFIITHSLKRTFVSPPDYLRFGSTGGVCAGR